MNNKNRYSPKESLGLLIIANENVSFKEMDNLILALEQVLMQNKSKTEILEYIDVDLLSQIDNYWELRKSQVIAYGYFRKYNKKFCISNEILFSRQCS